jgi:hemerythrin-like domain-containing protein
MVTVLKRAESSRTGSATGASDPSRRWAKNRTSMPRAVSAQTCSRLYVVSPSALQPLEWPNHAIRRSGVTAVRLPYSCGVKETPSTVSKEYSMDATELLMQGHREAERLFTKLPAEQSQEQRRSTAELLIAALSKHDAVEVQILYPTLRREGQAGDQLSNHALDEHRDVRELLHELDKHLDDVMEPSFVGSWQRLERMVREHVQEEETEIFPLLRNTLSRDDLEEMGTRIEKAKQTAPTHPHPTTPDNPVGATVMGAAAGLADRARDAMTGRETK